MDDPDEHRLVVKAITDDVSNCILWEDRLDRRVRSDARLLGWKVTGIRKELVGHVKSAGSGCVKQIPEQREVWKDDHRFYYKIIVPIDDFLPRGVFVEVVMRVRDPDCPVIQIVNVHRQEA